MAKATKQRVAPGIYKVSTGVYDLAVSTGKRPDGRYGQVTRRVRGTLGDAKTERGRMLADVQDGKVTVAPDITMDELHCRFMAARPTLATATKHQYEYLWTKLGANIGNSPVRKLKAIDLDHTYTAILGEGVGANTVRKCHKHARALLLQAMKWEIVRRNVAHWATPPETARVRDWTCARVKQEVPQTRPIPQPDGAAAVSGGIRRSPRILAHSTKPPGHRNNLWDDACADDGTGDRYAACPAPRDRRFVASLVRRHRCAQ